MVEFKLGGDSAKSGPTGGLYDVIVIGAGPAGLAASIYAARDGIKTLVLEKAAAGGLGATADLVENYPGFPEGIHGPELMNRFHKQARRFGAEIVEYEEVKKLEPVTKGLIRVNTSSGKAYEGRMVFLAMGSRPKKLGVPGEDEFFGRGLSYCATCDGPIFKGKDVVVVGAGNSGLQEGLYLLNYVKSVAFVEFLPVSPAEKITQDRAMNHPRSKFYLNHQPLEIKGDQKVTGMVIKDRASGEVKELPCEGIFIYVGYNPDTEFVKNLVVLDERGYIRTDSKMRTNVDGVLAIGDVRADNLAQYTVAVSDGTKAAIAAREYLAGLKSEN